MVELVGHTFVHGTITLDVDVLAHFVGNQDAAEGKLAISLELLGEEVPCAASDTK